MALLQPYWVFHDIMNKPSIHEAYIVTLVTPHSFHSSGYLCRWITLKNLTHKLIFKAWSSLILLHYRLIFPIHLCQLLLTFFVTMEIVMLIPPFTAFSISFQRHCMEYECNPVYAFFQHFDLIIAAWFCQCGSVVLLHMLWQLFAVVAKACIGNKMFSSSVLVATCILHVSFFCPCFNFSLASTADK